MRVNIISPDYICKIHERDFTGQGHQVDVSKVIADSYLFTGANDRIMRQSINEKICT